jgi:hypothetical protein
VIGEQVSWLRSVGPTHGLDAESIDDALARLAGGMRTGVLARAGECLRLALD